MITGKATLLATTAVAAVIAAASPCQAEIHCPPASTYRSKYENGAKSEWCEQVGSDDKPLLEGPYSQASPDFRVSGAYHDGKKEGPWKVYSGSGGLISETQWSAGHLDGESKSFVSSANGQTQVESGELTYSVRNGVWESHYRTGALRSRVSYKSGRKDGEEQSYDPEGKLTESAEYASGRLKRLDTFYPSGQKRTEETYGDAPSDYEWSVWDSNGQRVLHGNYRRNLPDGEWVRTGADGKTLRRTVFSDGKILSDSGTKVALDDPALMTDPTPSRLLDENSESRPVNPLGIWEIVMGSATLTSGIYALNDINPIDPQTGQPTWDLLGLLSAAEGGLAIGFGVLNAFWVDELYSGQKAVDKTPAATTTHEDRLLRERYMELYLKQVNDRARKEAVFDTVFFGLLNGFTLWHDHNVQCGSCTVAAAVATGTSFLPLLTYWARERSTYRQLNEEKDSLFSPSMSVSFAPEASGGNNYAMGLRWNL